MSPDSISVTNLKGELSTWNISRNLGKLHRPINFLCDDKESIGILSQNLELQSALQSMIWEEIAEISSFARKDGIFGVLYERNFDCFESRLSHKTPAATRQRVVRRVLADISGELEFYRKLPENIEFCIPDPMVIKDRKVGLWAFIPINAMDDSLWDYDLIEEVVNLLTL